MAAIQIAGREHQLPTTQEASFVLRRLARPVALQRKDQMFADFGQKVGQLQQKRADIDKLVDTALLHNGFVGFTFANHTVMVSNTPTQNFSGMVNCAPEPTPLMQTAALEPVAAHEALNKQLMVSNTRFITDLRDVMNGLVKEAVLGLCQWYAQDSKMCAYYHTYIGRKYTTWQDSQHVHHSERTTLHADLYELVNAQTNYIDFAVTLERHTVYVGGQRLGNVIYNDTSREIIKAIPDWLKEDVYVITGDAISKWSSALPMGEKTWTTPIPPAPVEKPDPALILGQWVLYAW